MVIRYIFVFVLLIAPSAAAEVNEPVFSDETLAEITIKSSSHLTYERLRELTILEAAKIAQSRGYTHFEFMYTKDRAVTGSVERQGDVLKDVYGNASQSSFSSYLVPTTIRKGQRVLVKFCNDAESFCKGANARSVLNNLHP